MNVFNKNILVVGMARSGIAVSKALLLLGAKVTINDLRTENELHESLKELNDLLFIKSFGVVPDQLIDNMDMIIISPSVPIDSDFIKRATMLHIPVLSELECAYQLCKGTLIGITGTNGKTTTTALTGEIFKNAGNVTHVVGNIGIPFSGKVHHMKTDDIIIAEVSSFQLEAIEQFKPKISVILNITEDHLNRHKTMGNYISMKARIFENQTSSDFVILNYEDKLAMSLATKVKAHLLFFSSLHKLDCGSFVEDDNIIFQFEGLKKVICNINEIRIPGKHNLVNALAAVTIACIMKIPISVIRHTLLIFPGIEHRTEFVKQVEDVDYINDSKGTNPDASIKAIQAMKKPTVVIAGGMNKGSDFSEFIDSFDGFVTALVVLGETAELIMNTARNKGFSNIYKVADIQAAVITAHKLAKPGDCVLLSPACASWDMFKDYEERGHVFKEAVYALRG